MLQIVYHTFFQPHQLTLSGENKIVWWQGAFVVLLVSTLFTLAMAGPAGWNASQLTFGIPLAWGESLFIWWLFSVILHFSADIFGGQGRIAQVLAATGFSATPFLLLPTLVVLSHQFGAIGQTLSVLGGMALLFWSAALLGRLLATSESLPFDRALGVLMMAFFVIGALLVSTMILGGLQIAFLGASLL